MRVSTQQMYQNGVGRMQDLRGDLLKLQNQLSTGQKLLVPSDDPAGTVEAMNLDSKTAAITQYGRNADNVNRHLGQEETALTSMTSALQRVRQLALTGANGTQTDESRAAIAKELRQLQQGLLQTANTKNANGEFLFAGFQSANKPFVAGAGGQIEYHGDANVREVEIAPGTKISIGNSGQAFMTLPTGNGQFTVTPATANTGSGVVADAEVSDPSTFTGASYNIVMTAPDTYEIHDSTNTVVGTGTYTAGEAIDVGGMRVVLKGTPATGDSFALAPSGNTSVFAVVDALAMAMETPADTPAAQAQLQQQTRVALMGTDQAINRVTALRTDVGARMNTLDRQKDANSDQSLQLQSALSSVQDLDYAAAISQYSIQQTALQVAQQTYAQVAKLSLFNWLR